MNLKNVFLLGLGSGAGLVAMTYLGRFSVRIVEVRPRPDRPPVLSETILLETTQTKQKG